MSVLLFQYMVGCRYVKRLARNDIAISSDFLADAASLESAPGGRKRLA
jgi:hypothetical protein